MLAIITSLYRRIFGLIEISQRKNPQLNEKAGREGFRENNAYRQFRAILINFFVQIAADFFMRVEAQAPSDFWAARPRSTELKRQDAVKRNNFPQSGKLLASN